MNTREELIGLEVKIADSKNKNIVGLRGNIIDETRNTLIINTPTGQKTIVKEQCKFVVRINEKWETINGEDIVGRPEDRIKK